MLNNGTFAVEIVHYKGAVDKAEAKLAGDCLVSDEADDEAAEKASYAILAGG